MVFFGLLYYLNSYDILDFFSEIILINPYSNISMDFSDYILIHDDINFDDEPELWACEPDKAQQQRTELKTFTCTLITDIILS